MNTTRNQNNAKYRPKTFQKIVSGLLNLFLTMIGFDLIPDVTHIHENEVTVQ